MKYLNYLQYATITFATVASTFVAFQGTYYPAVMNAVFLAFLGGRASKA